MYWLLLNMYSENFGFGLGRVYYSGHLYKSEEVIILHACIPFVPTVRLSGLMYFKTTDNGRGSTNSTSVWATEKTIANEMPVTLAVQGFAMPFEWARDVRSEDITIQPLATQLCLGARCKASQLANLRLSCIKTM